MPSLFKQNCLPIKWSSLILLTITTLAGFLFPGHAMATQPATKEIQLDTDTEININVFNANGQYRLLWIPSFAIPLSSVDEVATQLNRLNIEVWHADFLEARFLPKTASNIYKIPEQDIITVIKSANRDSNKKLFIYAESRAVIPLLLALREIQQSDIALDNFGGVILNSPYFYTETPDPGMDAQMMPIVSATNLPVFLFQPKNSPRYWQLKQTIPALEQSGSDVFVQVLAGIRGRFLFRPDATHAENALADKFGSLIVRAIKHLETLQTKTRLAGKQNIAPIRNAGRKKDHYLQKYRGDPHPPPLMLQNLSGKTVDLKNLVQKVVLVNFWASWCPPCIEEMPSMQRLSEKLPEDAFLILGVNIAESKTIVEKFLSEQIKIDFPILLDSDGEVMRQWNVMAFPTSFVIDKRGKIRYALFGSIDWDTPDIIKTLQQLLDE